MLRFVLGALIFLFGGLALADSSQFPVPPLTGPVIDEYGVMDADRIMQLNQFLLRFNDSGKAQIQVYVVKSLLGLPIEEVAIQVAEKWKLGDAKKDNGLLFLVAPAEHKMRFEVGQGLEGIVPDILAKRIQTEVVVPHFREGNYANGIVAGVFQLLKIIDNDFVKSHPEMQDVDQPEVRQRRTGQRIPIQGIILLIVIIAFMIRGGGGGTGLFILGSLLGGGGRGGGGGGSSWSGGGGGFSGGGASSDW